jgi:phosphoribosylglycinamide formyltransferase 1
VHPTDHVGHFVEAVHDQIRRDLLTPSSRATHDEDRLVAVELADALGDLTHGDECRVREDTLLPFEWLPDVEDRPPGGVDPALPFLRRHVFDHGDEIQAARRACRAFADDLYTPAAADGRVEVIINIAVLASGSGTNLQALIDAPDLRGDIGLVLSDRADATALDRAHGAGIPTKVLPWGDYGSRSEFSTAIREEIEKEEIELIVLAGFMRVLGNELVGTFRNQILNIHPSLLPAFPGAHAVDQALEHGVKMTGVTVHFVDEEVDHGPIIAQRSVPVLSDDDRYSLHARIQAEEHDLYPKVVAALARGEITVEGRKVRWD